MSPAQRTFALVGGALGLACVVGTLKVFVLEPASAPAPPPRAAAPQTAPSPLPAEPEAPESGEGLRSAPPPPDLAAAVDSFLAHVKVAPFPRPREVLAEARGGRLDPVDYRTKLEKALRHRGGPREGAELLLGMGDDSEVLRFQTAYALSKRLDDEAVDLLLERLPSADPRVRPQLVFALRGSPRKDVEQAFVSLYTTDEDPAVRAQAAFVIGERGDRLDPLLLERARQQARDDLRADDRTRMRAGMDVLGTPPLGDDDRRLLEGIVARDGNEARRLAALQALAMAKVPAAELAPLLRSVAQDPRSGPKLRAAAEAILSSLERPPDPRADEDDDG
ncbi:MAG: HEAT repeat domain-containing protein [Planctomycetota bacterium]|nr:MAG: HEAT repeat domain-containing protein [Planctomycetota bacterium]